MEYFHAPKKFSTGLIDGVVYYSRLRNFKPPKFQTQDLLHVLHCIIYIIMPPQTVHSHTQAWLTYAEVDSVMENGFDVTQRPEIVLVCIRNPQKIKIQWGHQSVKNSVKIMG